MTNGHDAQNPGAGNYASVNGLEMYYEIHGTGQPLVVLHGAFMSIGTMGELVPELAKTRQVIAVELQAHGRTADIDRPLSYEQMADDVAALLRHLEIEKADVFGYSMEMKQLDMKPFAWPPEDIRAIAAPTLLIVGDSDGTRPEHAVEMFRLLGGGVFGDVAGLPSSQLAVLPGTTHAGLVERSDWLVSMIGEFVDAPMPEAE